MKKLILVLLLIASTSVIAANLQGGNVVGRNIFGLAMDYQGDPVLIEDKPLIYQQGQADQSVELDEQKYMVSMFNHSIGNVYISHYDQQLKRYFDTTALNLSSVGGISNPGELLETVWGSLLAGESGLVDALDADSFIKGYQYYFKNKKELVKPYNYGYVLETILLNSSGEAKLIKNYAAGRVFASTLLMMPDGQTLYMLDSQHSGNLYIFVADKTNSLGKGQLFVTEMTNGSIRLVPLGKTSALKVKFKLKKINSDSIFQVKAPKGGHCDKGYTFVESAYGKECLKLNKKNKRYAGVFEPLRMAAIEGVQGFGHSIKNIHYDQNKNYLELVTNQGSVVNLGFGQHPDVQSSFLIKEVR